MSMKSLATVLLAASATVALPAFASPSAITDEFRLQFQRVVDGDTSLTDSLEEKSRAMVQADPGDPLARSYHGALLTLQGRDAWAPWTKMRKVEQGLDEIDKALNQTGTADSSAGTSGPTPELETRMTAIGTYLGLPDMFHRLDSARALLRQTMKRTDFASAPHKSRARIFAWAADAAARAGEKSSATELAQQAKAEGWSGATK